MNLKLKTVLTFFVFFLWTVMGVAADSKNIPEISPDYVETLLAEGRVTRNVDGKNDTTHLEFLPNSPLAKDFLKVSTTESKPSFLTESLYYIEKPEGSTGSDMKLISQIVQSISTLEGIEYYSNSAGKTKILYSDVYVIDNLKNKNKLPDDETAEVNNRELYTCFVDASFGECFYKVNYKQKDNELSMIITLVEPIKFGFINAIKADNLVICINILDKGDYLLMYLNAKVNYPSLSIFDNRVRSSLQARVDALYNWFVSSYEDKKSK